MPKFKVVNLDAPEEIDFYQDIPLVDPDTGTDQLDSEGNILVKRYVNHTVSIKGITEVKNALPAIKTNTKNLEELYQYSHAQNEAQQIAINENASAIVDLNTSTSEMALELETLKNKINGIQGIDIDDLKDYVYTQVPLIKNSYLPLTGGTITGNLTIEEGTITGSLTGVASNATADVNNKKLTSYVADIMGANAQLSIIKGDGTNSVVSINNVLNATSATNANHAKSADSATQSTKLTLTRYNQSDCNNVTSLGYPSVVATEYNLNSANLPSSHWYQMLTLNSPDVKYSNQLAFNMNTLGMYYRLKRESSWLSWVRLIDSTNIGRQSVKHATSAENATTATTATKASQNAAGYSLADTIVKAISISGRTITVTKLDGKTYTLTTQDTNTTYSKVSQFTNDSGYITNSHNFSSGVKVSGYTITVG